MADVQLVIKIPEGIMEYIKNNGCLSVSCLDDVAKAIQNGTPLPKGRGVYGELITKEQAIELVEFYQMNPQHFSFVDLIDEIKDEKPLIEADKEDKEPVQNRSHSRDDCR